MNNNHQSNNKKGLSKRQKRLNNKWVGRPKAISRELRDLIHGYIMSDGYVNPSGYLQVDLGEKQANFVQWLYDQLESLRTNNPPRKVERFNKQRGGTTHSLRFTTRNILQGFYAMWYEKVRQPNGTLKYRKKLPKSLMCFFSPTCITLWYAGDGTKEGDSRAMKIEVTAFSVEERLRLQQLFKVKYNITTSINRAGTSKTGTEQWVIRIPADEAFKFRDIITKMDLIPNLFPDKLPSQE